MSKGRGTVCRMGCAALLLGLTAAASADERQLVQLPEMMQQHMLGNMRDHLRTLNGILAALAKDDTAQAAQLAEQRLGMSSLAAHGAEHMAPFMPPAMRDAGTAMHHAASQFAQVVEEGDSAATYAALNKVTTACVACHEGFRIR